MTTSSHKKNIEAVYSLSPMQEGMLFHSLYEPDEGFYFEQFVCTLRGDLNTDAFERAWNQIIDRHPILRTSFVWKSIDQMLQVVHRQVTLPFTHLDWRQYSPADQELLLTEFINAERQRGFDLSKAPLLRLALIRKENNTYNFVWCYHHALLDGWSQPLLLNEFIAFYEAFSQGSELDLGPVRPYRNYIDWIKSQDISKAESFWRQSLEGVKAPTPLVVNRKPGAEVSIGEHLETGIHLSESTTQKLLSLASEYQLTINTFVLGAWASLLARYSGQSDVLFGVTVSGRPPELPGSNQMVGLFINTLPMRVQIPAEGTAISWLQGLQAHQVDLRQYEYTPLVKIQDWSDIPGGISLFDSILIFENYPFDILMGKRDRSLEIDNVRISERANYPLNLVAALGQDLFIKLVYDNRYFDEPSIHRMLGNLGTWLESIARYPEQQITALPLLTQAERRQILVEWNDTSFPYPNNCCIHQLFEAQAIRTPEAVAVISNGQQLTYKDLNYRANQLAHYLRDMGVGPETLVGIFLDRSLSLVVGILGILKAGGAYVPLDVSYPADRLSLMLSNAQLPVLLSENRFMENLPESNARVVLLDDREVTKLIGSSKSENPDSGVKPENLVYLIFTSGSTGEPKGVMLEHAGLVNLALSQIEAFDITPGDRVLQFASIGFDASVSEIFTTLVSGASLYLASRDIISSPPDLVELLRECKINVVTLPPSLLQVMPSHDFPALKTLVSAGEKCSWEITKKWSHIPRLINAYGPTEATVGPTYYLLEGDQTNIQQEGNSVPIGRPISNVQLYILDDQLRPVPIGVPGELHIGGAGLARGYLNEPEQTGEKFIYHSFDSQAPVRLYKTGDLVRYLPDGNVEYLGRVDHQVKVRGFRIELEEIESVLIQHPSVQNAVVVAQTDNTGDNKLIAYVLLEQGESQDVAALRRFLRSKLPGYMVPALFILLPDLPLTKNGKVDRTALPFPDGAQTGLEDDYIAPQTPHQELLAGIFSLILGVKPIGIDDDFFELGGHSLLVTRLVSRIRKAFQVELNLRDVFDAPTVRSLAGVIQAASQKEDQSMPPPITPTLRDEVLPLSFAQQRLWFLDQLLPGNAFYNLPTAVRLSGDLNLDALGKSVNEVVKRHESLRTTFILENGEPFQKISSTLTIPLPLVDLSQESQITRDQRVKDWIVEEARKPFDLTKGPLLRAQILRTSPDEHIILFTMHHIISDGWSMRVLISEIAALYPAFISGHPSPLPNLPVQYADFTIWQRNWLQGEILEKHKEYWKSKLADSPSVLELPTDRPRSAVQSSRGAHLSFKLPLDLSTAVREYAHQEGATLFMMLLSAFMTLLYRYSGQIDINVGTPIANRTRNEIEGLIGFFVNTLVMRADLSGNPSFRDFLHRIRETAFEAYAHQDLPFETLVEMLQPVRDMSHSPLFQVMFTLDNVPSENITLPGLTLSALNAESGTSKFDLTLSIQDGLDSLEGNLEYNSDLFDQATIERIVMHFQVLLESIVANPNQRISGLPILTPSEQTRMLVTWNNTVAPFASDKCFHHLFEHWVKHSPEAPAVRFGAETLTYAELNARSNQFANFLQSLGVGPETLVGVCLKRSVELVISLLGVWKAGGAYIPLDPEYPEDRLAYMLSDSRVTVLVTQEHLRNRLSQFDVSVISIDRDWDQISQYNHDQPPSIVIPGNLAYMIYTSGSTGLPKGVQLTHTGLCNVVATQQAAFKVGPGDRVLQFSSLSFDAATFELVMGLGTGATLCLAPRESLLPGRDLLATLEETAATIVVFPPSALNVLPVGDLPALRVITVAGEACPAELVDRWAPGRQFYNLYGPTEDTIWATYAACSVGKVKPPIGRPIFNNQVYILDAHGEPVPVGVAGELYIGGVGVARGYLGKPGLTAERFLPNPYGNGDRLYRTGDIVRYQVDGNLEFVGREDDQVKVRGFRIELGEIEVALHQLPEVQEVVVLARSDQPGEPRLVAYIVPENGVVPDPTSLRQALARKLPNYMVPGIFVNLDHLPLLPSGKVDRARLPAPEGSQQHLDTEFVQPRNELEKTLVEMWQRIIRVDQIGVNDNFFELGGDSIRGAVFINQLEKILGQSIYVAALFEAQTISELANYLISNYPVAVVERLSTGSEAVFDLQSATFENGKAPIPQSVHPSMVPIQPQGSKYPLFCVHSAGGVVFPYYNLVPYLGNDQPLYGVQDPSYVQMDKSFSSLEDIAAYYVDGLQKVQPSGPYHIAGWSSGGVMAFEMAQQLSRQGEKVAFLGIIDFRAPGQFVPSKRQPRLEGKGYFEFGHFHMVLKTLRVLPNMVKEFLILLKSALSYTWDGLYLKYRTPNQDKTAEKPTLKEYLKWFWISAWRSSFLEKSELAKSLPRDSNLLLIELPTVRHVLGRVGEDIRLTRKYVPEVYDGKITVLSAGSFEADNQDPKNTTMGWDQLTEGEVEVRKIPGNHMAVLHKPYVESFAQIIKDCLDQASKE